MWNTVAACYEVIAGIYLKLCCSYGKLNDDVSQENVSGKSRIRRKIFQLLYV